MVSFLYRNPDQYANRKIGSDCDKSCNFTYRINNKRLLYVHVSNTDIIELIIKSLHLHVTSVQSFTPILNFYATILQDMGPELQLRKY